MTEKRFALFFVLNLVGKRIEAANEIGSTREYFKPFIANRQFEVQPLLTPDNFHEHALALINSAKTELFIQNQTFNAPKPSHKQLDALVAAVLAKQKAGVKAAYPHVAAMAERVRKPRGRMAEPVLTYGFTAEDLT